MDTLVYKVCASKSVYFQRKRAFVKVSSLQIHCESLPGQQFANGCLATATSSNNGSCSARCHTETHIGQDRLARNVAEAHIVKFYSWALVSPKLGDEQSVWPRL